MTRASEGLASFGWQQLEDGDAATAIIALRAATALSPHAPGLWKAYGVAAMKAGRETEAIRAFQRAITLDDRDLEATVHAAELMLRNLDYAGAVALLKRALVLDDKAAHPFGVRARMLVRKAQNQIAAASSTGQRS